METLIGRKTEKQILETALQSSASQFQYDMILMLPFPNLLLLN
jgi:hypothetical protein